MSANSKQINDNTVLASQQVSHVVKEQDCAAEEISSSVVRLHNFLLSKSIGISSNLIK